MTEVVFSGLAGPRNPRRARLQAASAANPVVSARHGCGVVIIDLSPGTFYARSTPIAGSST
jgi:hypothetical protein